MSLLTTIDIFNGHITLTGLLCIHHLLKRYKNKTPLIILCSLCRFKRCYLMFVLLSKSAIVFYFLLMCITPSFYLHHFTYISHFLNYKSSFYHTVTICFAMYHFTCCLRRQSSAVFMKKSMCHIYW